MRIKIVRNPVVCGGSLAAEQYRKAIKKHAGRWVEVETDYIFSNQYNIADLRVMGENVDKVDYQGDKVLEVIHNAMAKGNIQCHSYRHDTGEFVDLYGLIPTSVAENILRAYAKMREERLLS